MRSACDALSVSSCVSRRHGERVTVVGIDIGGTSMKGGLLKRDRLGATARAQHDTLGPGTGALVQLKQRIRRLIAKVAEGRSVDGVGLSVSGFISADRSRVSNNTLQLDRVALPAEIADDLGIPVMMENDGNCAAWAEYVAGVGAGRNPFVLLTFGTGVGGGIIVDGRIVRGSHGLASELGHISIDPVGPQCPCGGVGCLELYASGRAMIRAFAASRQLPAGMGIPPAGPFDRTELRNLEAAFARALAAGEPSADQALGQVGRAAARGLLLLARILDPELIAVGGGLSEIGQPLIDAIRSGVLACPGMTSPVSTVPIVLARNGNDAGALGAALLAAARLSLPS
jgi:glucokinase